MMILTSLGSGQALMHIKLEHSSTASANPAKNKIQKGFLLILKEVCFPFIGFPKRQSLVALWWEGVSRSRIWAMPHSPGSQLLGCVFHSCTAQVHHGVYASAQNCGCSSALALPKGSLYRHEWSSLWPLSLWGTEHPKCLSGWGALRKCKFHTHLHLFVY